MSSKHAKTIRERGIYLLPNLLTSAALFAGYYAIVAAMKGRFDAAAIAIFVAMIADALDGRVARLMNANTPFGVQYDSLSDMVSFGLAPSLVLFSWSLHMLGKVGWLVAFLYTAAVALRLARFNIQVEMVDKRYFKGLPCPLAAGVIAAFVWLFHDMVMTKGFSSLVVAVSIMLAALMVSNVRYHSFKEIEFKGRVPFFSLLLIIIIFVAISMCPPMVLLIIFSGYALSGPVLTLYKMQRAFGRRKTEDGRRKTEDR